MSDLLRDIETAANCLDRAGEFPTGSGILREAAARIRELEAQLAAPVAVKVKPLVWDRYGKGCYTVKSMKDADNGCDVTYYAERATPSGIIVNTVMKPGYSRSWIDGGEEYDQADYDTIESAKAAAQARYDARILATVESVPVAEVWRRAIDAVVAEIRQWDDYSIGGRDLAIDRFRALPIPDDLGGDND